MKLINRDTDYALKALLAVARRRPGETGSVSELSEDLDIPRPYLRKIMQTLARSGVVASLKGKNGGFSLARPPEAIRLAEILRIFQGDICFRDCLFRDKICREFRTCPLLKVLGRLEDRFVKELEAVTLASLLREEKGARAGVPGRRARRSSARKGRTVSRNARRSA